MAARYYFQIRENDGGVDQAEDDSLVFPADDAAWREVLGGTFRISWIAPAAFDSLSENYYTLLHVDTPDDVNGLEFYVQADDGVKVTVNLGGTLVQSGSLTFGAGDELTFEFSAIDGSVTVAGATTGNGTTTDTPWNVTAGDVYLGRNFSVGNYAGWVSLPYAVKDAPTPGAAYGQWDFSDLSQSGHLLTY